MRPKNTDSGPGKDKNSPVEEGKVDLQVINYEETGSKSREIIENSVIMATKENWEVSKDEYLQHLAK